jgi:CRISPR-associated protein Csm3
MDNRKLSGKIIFQGTLQCLTGLHIGASKENMEIGALDSPVVRDPITRQPYIPGASLKGKLRTLLEKATPTCLPNRNGGTSAQPVMRHECDDVSQAKDCPVCRLFGSTAGRGKNPSGQENRNYPARLKVRDLYLTPASLTMLEKIDTGLLYTEWKFENALDRITSAANPRNLERVPKGAEFVATLVYDVEDLETAKEDLKNLQLALRLLEDDALGGHGSRGYGQVRVHLESVIGRKVDDYKEPTTAAFGREVSDMNQLDDLWQYLSSEKQE